MRRYFYVLFGFVSIALTSATPSSAQPAFVNGILIRETSSTRLASPVPTADVSAFSQISITTRRLTSGGRCRTAVRAADLSATAHASSASRSTSISSPGTSRTSECSKQ